MQIGRPSTGHVQSLFYIDEACSPISLQVLGQSDPSNLSRGSQNLIAWMHLMTKGTHALPALPNVLAVKIQSLPWNNILYEPVQLKCNKCPTGEMTSLNQFAFEFFIFKL